MGNISKNFSWEEFFVSKDFPKLAKDTWVKEHTNLLFKQRVTNLAHLVLQPIRDSFGPVKITSAIRSKELNDKVGGVGDSDHLTGCACDFTVSGYGLLDVMKWISHNCCHKVAIYYPDKKFIHVAINWPGFDYNHTEFVKIGNTYEPLSKYIKKEV